MNAEVVNQKMKEEFEKSKSFQTLERYAMSELL